MIVLFLLGISLFKIGRVDGLLPKSGIGNSFVSLAAGGACHPSVRRAKQRRRLFMTATATEFKVLPGIGSVVDEYDAFLIDQWGVMHDGTRAYPGAIETIARLALLGKHVILLSNSSKRKSSAFANLKRMGFHTEKILDIVTSGELAWEGLQARKEEPFKSLGQRCFVLGNGEDDVDYAHSAGCLLSSAEAADFILARGVFATAGGRGNLRSLPEEEKKKSAKKMIAGETEQEEQEEAEVIRYLPNLFGNVQVEAGLKAAAAKKTPMLVTNPDFLRPGTNDPMPGMLARYYAALGGSAQYVGKPYPLVYERCFELLASRMNVSDRSRICAIGDSLEHDIRGALSAGIASIFVTGGVHHAELGLPQGAGNTPPDVLMGQLYAKHLGSGGADGQALLAPSHAVPAFRW